MAGYKITHQNALHYLTLTTVGWIDVFTRQRYRDILLESPGDKHVSVRGCYGWMAKYCSGVKMGNKL